MMGINFSMAFETVNHIKMLQAVSSSTLNHNTVRWLVAYLRGRTASCRYLDVTSVCHAMPTGVPQGSVIIPVLFNLFFSNVQLLTGYMNDVHTVESSVKPQITATALTAYAEVVGY